MADSNRSLGARLLRWAGGLTAILSLVFAVQKALQLVTDGRERRRVTAEHYQTGKLQQSAADYASAWTSFDNGLKAAEPGGQLARLTGQLTKERRQLREAQEDLAMEWLRNVRVSPDRGETLSGVAQKLLPVLNTGIVSGAPERKADLLAHLGWAHFLMYRDNRTEFNPELQYKQALQADQQNVYAHAFSAHWQLWQGRAPALKEANRHFAAALATNKARDQVRHLQFAAYVNLGQAGDLELLRLFNEMRKNKEPIDDAAKNRLWNVYWSVCPPRTTVAFDSVLKAIPIAEHMETFQTLFADFEEGKSFERDACKAALLEAAGQRAEAREVWVALRARLNKPFQREWRERADLALRRLPAGQ